jgi:hypothetical protein
MSIYDDPNLRQDDDFPDQVSFNARGDRVKGRVIRFESLKTRYGMVAKYWLFDLDRNMERTMLAGAKNLWGQLLTLQPMPGDVLDIELVDFAKNENGTAKLFEVSVERTNDIAPTRNEPLTRAAQAQQSPANARPAPDPRLQAVGPDNALEPRPAPSPVAVQEDEDADLFDR